MLVRHQVFSACSSGSTSILLPLLPLITVRWLHCCRLAAVKGDSPKTASGAALQPGLLVAFKKDERTELGLLLQPDGKKNWVVANEVSLQAVVVTLPRLVLTQHWQTHSSRCPRLRAVTCQRLTTMHAALLSCRLGVVPPSLPRTLSWCCPAMATHQTLWSSSVQQRQQQTAPCLR